MFCSNPTSVYENKYCDDWCCHWLLSVAQFVVTNGRVVFFVFFCIVFSLWYWQHVFYCLTLPVWNFINISLVLWTSNCLKLALSRHPTRLATGRSVENWMETKRKLIKRGFCCDDLDTDGSSLWPDASCRKRVRLCLCESSWWHHSSASSWTEVVTWGVRTHWWFMVLCVRPRRRRNKCVCVCVEFGCVCVCVMGVKA